MKLFNTPTVVDLRRPSGTFWKGAVWSSRVTYDAWGAPYAEDVSAGEYQLWPDGKIKGGYRNIEWKHRSGPPVRFEEPQE